MFCSCDNDESEISKIENLRKKYPECVVDKIKKTYNEGFEGTTIVAKYSYNNEIVYRFDSIIGGSSSNAGGSVVLNNNCEIICGVSSGVVYTNTCVDWDKATFIETVWKNPR